MASLVDALDGHLDAVEVTELHDGAFIASLTLSGPAGQRRIDTRPSDAIALAVRLSAPLFVAEAVLDEAGALPPAEPQDDPVAIEAAIDAEVDQFRAFLDELDPTDFIDDRRHRTRCGHQRRGQQRRATDVEARRRARSSRSAVEILPASDARRRPLIATGGCQHGRHATPCNRHVERPRPQRTDRGARRQCRPRRGPLGR